MPQQKGSGSRSASARRSAREPAREERTTTVTRYPGHEEAYRLLFLARLIDDEAPNFLRKNLGWSYHAPCAGHEGIQLALGCSFRPSFDYLFPYYRDLCTCLAAGMTPTEIILNGLSRRDDVAGAAAT